MERYAPLTDLALELGTGEYANYTVREVGRPCTVCLEGVGECEVEILCNGQPVGTVKLPEGDILHPALSEKVTVPAGEEQTVKVRVKSGVLTLKAVKFAYD